MKNGYWVIEMTLEQYETILKGVSEGVLLSIYQANKIYAEQYPNAQFTMFRRKNDSIKVGYSSIIIPSCYVEKYFENPARREDICYTNIGAYLELREEHRQFIKNNHEGKQGE